MRRRSVRNQRVQLGSTILRVGNQLSRRFVLITAILFMLLSHGGCASLLNQSAIALTVPDTDQVDVRFGVARMLERNGEIQNAKKLYEEILEEVPAHQPTRHRLGVVLLKQERLDEAIEHLRFAAEGVDPEVEAIGDLGFALFLNDDLAEAEKSLRMAIERDPTNERCTNNLAIVLGHQKRYQESLQLFRKVGSEVESQVNIAYVMAVTGELELAKQHYHRALELEPNNVQAAKGLSEFSRLEQSR
ncbi:tetratricopeptide repeat protein [Stieleria sp. JC731]|uniref:tetratricopeptide repeat protein n=1 Tax=Pirellulaceae TaxID=2691357 RepID=UPI001E53ECA7|nr:tetratricopeptide repeat protein [Stieleria sp. JC731]MCC9602739.1 tetratricopeptide repeat protein [Stieleria sp. JC731]